MNIAFQINILASRPDRFPKPVRSENFYFSEKVYLLKTMPKKTNPGHRPKLSVLTIRF